MRRRLWFCDLLICSYGTERVLIVQGVGWYSRPSESIVVIGADVLLKYRVRVLYVRGWCVTIMNIWIFY